jgi:hypothetical protein
MRTLSRVCYRVGGSFEGVIVTDDIRWALERADRDLSSGWTIEADPITPEDASIIPDRIIGRLLNEDEAAELERIVACPRSGQAAP